MSFVRINWPTGRRWKHQQVLLLIKSNRNRDYRYPVNIKVNQEDGNETQL